MSNAAILTYLTPSYGPLETITGRTRRAYCERHGYEYVVRKEANNRLFHPWRKYGYAYDLLDKFDILAVMDPDTMILNESPTLVEKMGDAEFMIAEDLYGVNSGVTFFRNTQKAKQFLYALCTVGLAFFGQHPFKEQAAIRDFINGAPYRDWATVCRQNHCNSYLNKEYGRPAEWEGNYAEGDWILQLPALKMQRRLQLAYEYTWMTHVAS